MVCTSRFVESTVAKVMSLPGFGLTAPFSVPRSRAKQYLQNAHGGELVGEPWPDYHPFSLETGGSARLGEHAHHRLVGSIDGRLAG